jgi:stage II sporulation protein D
MTRALIAVWLMLVAVSVGAQTRRMKVRLFWQHPPERIRVEPGGAMWKACASCAAKSIKTPIEIKAAGARLSVVPSGLDSRTDRQPGAEALDYTTSSHSAANDLRNTEMTISGRARISGEGFPAFPVDGELVVQPRDGVLLLTLTMPAEDYVAAVLAGESAGFKSDEGLKAMAVAARTYAAYFGSRHKLEGFDFCDTTHCQDVRLGNESARVRAAVAGTEGELLWYEGHPAATYYHRSSGGEIEDAAALDSNLHVPYLRRHQDQYCSRGDEWHAQIKMADLSRALERPVNTVSVASRLETGRVKTVVVNGRPMSATDFRLAIGRTLGWDKVRSDLYQLEDRGSIVAIRGRGQGHGVGLCQVGADNMGQQGHSYREILAYYYPGTALGINAQGLHWQTLQGESVDVITTSPADASVLFPVAERALRLAVERTGWSLNGRPQVKLFPTIAIYRDATGEPGWVAASTRGNIIRLQPLATLQRANAVESTLRHEFLHMVLESQASPKAPLWLHEGLAIYLGSSAATKEGPANVATLDSRLGSARTEAEMRAAYRASAATVADLVSRHGLPTVLEWLKNGLPPTM